MAFTPSSPSQPIGPDDDAMAVAGFSEDIVRLRPQLYVVRPLVIEKNSLGVRPSQLADAIRARAAGRLLGERPGTKTENQHANRGTQNRTLIRSRRTPPVVAR
jgi:hypothetical protein